MNQVENLGLAHTFAIVSPSNIENILHQTLSRDTNFTVVREVLHNNYQLRNLIGPITTLGNNAWAGHDTMGVMFDKRLTPGRSPRTRVAVVNVNVNANPRLTCIMGPNLIVLVVISKHTR